MSPEMPAEFYTASGVRLRRRWQRPGDLNWLLLPGGPGIGSESLYELGDILDVPGALWMVDLPGDGSNSVPPGSDPFEKWPHVLIEAAEALPRAVYVGHSTGGMYLLSVPELERRIVGLALISSAPDAGWRSPSAGSYCGECPITIAPWTGPTAPSTIAMSINGGRAPCRL